MSPNKAATDQAWQAISNLNWLAKTMDGALQETQQTNRNSEKRSNTALGASIEQTRQIAVAVVNDQRPHLSWMLKEIGVAIDTNRYPYTHLFVKNAGRGIALDARLYGCMFVFREDRPESEMEVVYTTARAQTTGARTDIAPSRESIPFTIWYKGPACPSDFPKDGKPFTPEETSIAEGKVATSTMRIAAGLIYKDSLGNEYESQGCFIIRPQRDKPLWTAGSYDIDFCPSHNTIRQTKQSNKETR